MKVALSIKKIIKIFVLMQTLFIPNFVEAQVEIKINTKSDIIEADQQGNIYIVYETELKKYNKVGKLIYSYTNNLLGNISCVDASNPLSILVFFEENNSIVFLNKQLAEISEPLQIDDLLNAQATLASNSTENGFWIFDKISETIMQYNRNNITNKKSENLTKYLNGDKALFLSEQYGYVYLQTSKQILCFDSFGNFLNTNRLSSKNKIYIINNKYCFFEFPNIKFVNMQTGKTEYIEIGKNENIRNAIVNKNTIILQLKETVIIKNIKNTLNNFNKK